MSDTLTVSLDPAPAVLRRWTAPRDAGEPARCGECGELTWIGDRCGECGELAAPAGYAGRMVVVVTIAGERQAVTVERSSGGGWAPVAVAPALDRLAIAGDPSAPARIS